MYKRQTKTRAPLAILIDDGWAAAATWDARVRTADDVIARADDDRRAVALIPLSEGTRDISLETAGSARVQLPRLRPAPYTIPRAEALPSLSRFLAETQDAELVWLSDGTDLGHGAEFIDGLAKAIGQHPITIVAGGVTGALALTAADNAAGALSLSLIHI